jgi:hypothetical protein
MRVGPAIGVDGDRMERTPVIGRGHAVIGALVAMLVLAGCSPAPPTAPPTPRPSVPALTPTTGPSRSPASSPVEVTREQAIAIARQAVPRWAAASVLQADQGRWADFGDPYAPLLVSPTPSPERLVWLINLGVVNGPLDAAGTDVVIDAADGSVVQIVDWIS